MGYKETKAQLAPYRTREMGTGLVTCSLITSYAIALNRLKALVFKG